MHGYKQNDIYGTWHPSGFHGHFRSKSREDFTIPYRQKAKPPPPMKFLNRSSVRSNDHLFSRHDNRNVHSATMGDLEMHFNHGLGKRKSAAGARQRYKDTSSLLRWSDEPRFTPTSSYKSDFLSQPLPQTRIVNKTEPVHIRRHLALRRTLLRSDSAHPAVGAPPLLAWNVPDKGTYAKPCIGPERNRDLAPRETTHRAASGESSSKLSRKSCSPEKRTFENANYDNNLSHVIETVTKLDL